MVPTGTSPCSKAKPRSSGSSDELARQGLGETPFQLELPGPRKAAPGAKGSEANPGVLADHGDLLLEPLPAPGFGLFPGTGARVSKSRPGKELAQRGQDERLQRIASGQEASTSSRNSPPDVSSSIGGRRRVAREFR